MGGPSSVWVYGPRREAAPSTLLGLPDQRTHGGNSDLRLGEGWAHLRVLEDTSLGRDMVLMPGTLDEGFSQAVQRSWGR